MFNVSQASAADALGAGSLASNLRPFTLATLAERFAPAIVEPSELRERGLTRVRIVTAAGLRLGLAKRLFAGEPLLPSDVEAEEEEHVSPSPVKWHCRVTALIRGVRVFRQLAERAKNKSGSIVETHPSNQFL